METFLVYDNSTGKGSRVVGLISVSSVDFLAFLGQRDLGLSYSVWSQVYLLVCWSILLKIERDLRLTVFPLGTTVRQKFTYIPCL